MRKYLIPKMHIEIEKWKFSMRYNCYVSTFGHIKDINKNIITPGVKNGYLYYKSKPVHRIVLETFAPVDGYEYLSVDHIDKNTRNARLSNLAWLEPSENIKKAAEEDKEHTVAINSEVEDEKIGYVLLNGAKLSISTAKQIMYNDKSLLQAHNAIDKAFNMIQNGAAQSKYGNYTLTKVV